MHTFHEECIQQYICSGSKLAKEGKCPECQQSIKTLGRKQAAVESGNADASLPVQPARAHTLLTSSTLPAHRNQGHNHLSRSSSVPSSSSSSSSASPSAPPAASAATINARNARLRRFQQPDAGLNHGGGAKKRKQLSREPSLEIVENPHQRQRHRPLAASAAPHYGGGSAYVGKWACPACTFENDRDAVQCGACSNRRSGASFVSSSFSSSSSSSSSALQGWTCSGCTIVNLPSAQVCATCSSASPRKRPSALISGGGGSAGAGAGADSAVKRGRGSCGACGQSGHTRGNYSGDHNSVKYCSKYNSAEEVERRAKKQAAVEEKARATQEAAQRLARENRQQHAQQNTAMQDIQQQLQVLQSQGNRTRELAVQEQRRLEQQARRAENRARKGRG